MLATRNASAQSGFSLLGGSAAAKSGAGAAGTLGGAAGGGRENPIHVTVSERTSRFYCAVEFTQINMILHDNSERHDRVPHHPVSFLSSSLRIL